MKRNGVPDLLVLLFFTGTSSILGRQEFDHGLVEWVVANGGYFNPKQEIRREIPEDDTSRFGIFATKRIEEGETLSLIPWNVTIQGDEDDYRYGYGGHMIMCDTASRVAEEIMLDQKSKYAPYISHLQAQSTSQLPTSWSHTGKSLLEDVLGDPPAVVHSQAEEMLEFDWSKACNGYGIYNNDLLANATMLVHQLAEDGFMIPISDLYTHRNGYWHNARLEETDGAYKFTALRIIEVGEPIHDSIYKCDDCENDYSIFYGTPELFCDHGLIERMPQRWTITEAPLEFYIEDGGEHIIFQAPTADLIFELDENDGGEITVEWDKTIEWIKSDETQINQVISWFRSEVRRLSRLKNVKWNLDWDEGVYDIPRHEWESIWAFHKTYIDALEYAIEDLEDMFVEDDDDDDVCENGDGEGENHGSINDPHYVDLTTHQTDRTVYNYQACESSELSDFRLYRLFKEEKTNYQNMTWQHRPEDDDMCLHLDNMLQICSSYRPHYHEFFVHYPARFLNSVRRVIFLGGGDAMLLHEILKYPDLELVVGLELDQQITRNSFKHFKTQPHFDDERVEWWYGDATKTLPLLPKEYWGSFDLALVDLSETVVSMSVTGQHDVLEVISMLLKPDGIMLENELYLEKMKNHFDHTIQIFYGSPKVCTQVLTMSSNGIDFLHHPINDHGVDAYLVEPMKEDHDRFKYIHDYWKTKARSQGKCQESLSANGAMTVEQGRRAGILEVLEAESTSTPLDNAIEKMLYSVIRKQGLTPVSTPSNSDGTVIVVMEEGYIVAHMLPMHRYCGFDINLWGSFSKLKDLRKALAEVVGSTSLSSYRIVVGGMHGSKTFEKDQENIGVQFSQKRNCEPDILNNNFSIGLETVATVLDETINLVQSRQLLVAVACGIEDEGICATLDIVSQNPNVRKVVPLWTCSGLTDHKNETNYQKMYDCENKLIDQLNEEIVSQSLKLDMVVFDYASPLHMFQMIASIMTVPSYREDWLKDQHVIMATLSKNENFKVEFMNEYRKKRHLSPVSKADLALKGGENSFLGITAVIHNDNYVLDHLYAMEANLRKRLPNFIVEIRRILGGELHSEADLGFEKLSFVPEKYDSNPAKVQSLQQRPVAHQSIFQLELDDEEDINDMPSFEELGLFLEKTLIKMGYHPSRFDKFTDVGNGGIIVSIFSFGNVILIFDGHTHVDINLFSFFKKKELSDSFISIFLDLSGERLEMHLRDDQPRGYGRVVSMYTGGD